MAAGDGNGSNATEAACVAAFVLALRGACLRAVLRRDKARGEGEGEGGGEGGVGDRPFQSKINIGRVNKKEEKKRTHAEDSVQANGSVGAITIVANVAMNDEAAINL